MSIAKVFLILILLATAKGIKLDRCDFVAALKENGVTNLKQLAIFTCLAEKLTNIETNITKNGLDEKYYGLFQVNSKYWCSVDGGCNISCEKLLDDDLSDDIKCAIHVLEETEKIKNEGFLAWPSYESCIGQEKNILDSCGIFYTVESESNSIIENEQIIKVYNKCELAKELVNNHNVPFDKLGTMVCIANEESHFNTSAVGALNSDGSRDFGIFQISEKYWCSDKNGGGCNMQCSKLLDSNLTDDVECFKKIYDETSRFSNSGFEAWAVYTREKNHCRDINQEYIYDCFNDLNEGRIFGICELIEEMRGIIPDDLLADFACIALYESSLSSGIVNWGHYGIFQINEQKWCNNFNDHTTKGCDISCDKLKDSNITDDIHCVKRIHTLLGFDPWPSYKAYCKNKSYEMVEGCPNVPRPKKKNEASYYLIQISDPIKKVKSTYQVHESQLRGNYIKIKTKLGNSAVNNKLSFAVTIESENEI